MLCSVGIVARNGTGSAVCADGKVSAGMVCVNLKAYPENGLGASLLLDELEDELYIAAASSGMDMT